jgi:hypothetical protein
MYKWEVFLKQWLCTWNHYFSNNSINMCTKGKLVRMWYSWTCLLVFCQCYQRLHHIYIFFNEQYVKFFPPIFQYFFSCFSTCTLSLFFYMVISTVHIHTCIYIFFFIIICVYVAHIHILVCVNLYIILKMCNAFISCFSQKSNTFLKNLPKNYIYVRRER